MSQAHNYAYLSSIPLTGAAITDAGDVTWTAVRIVDDVSHDPKYRIELEDKNEDGELVGELHADLEERIQLTVGVNSTFARPAKNSVVVIAGLVAPVLAWNGNWQVEEVGAVFKAGDRATVKITLRRNEFLVLTP